MTAMLHIDVLSLFAILGVAHGLFFAVWVWVKKDNPLFNRLLSLLLLVTSIRIAKNIVVHISHIDPDFEIPYRLWRLLVNVGLDHQFAIGPLFLLYFSACLNPGFKFQKQYWLHFLPYFVLMALSPIIEWNFWRYGGLWASYLHILAYYLLSLRAYRQHLEHISIKTKSWLRGLLMVAAVLMLAYSPALFKYVGYVGGAFLYAVGVYFASTILWREPKPIEKTLEKYKNSTLSEGQALQLKRKLELWMQEQKPFLDTDLTLNILATQLSISPNHLSQLINAHFNVNFSEYINSYRLEEAKMRLQMPENAHFKIASIAYDSGFNSLASFNTLFKKHTGLTPSSYRMQMSTKTSVSKS
ncbi:MAG: helix-turn-helix transcriptional regulator [Saprospiraceae bacterium]|nr:helix-turn-helix transcriptional regulator [Saprospiraceae bacterium]